MQQENRAAEPRLKTLENPKKKKINEFCKRLSCAKLFIIYFYLKDYPGASFCISTLFGGRRRQADTVQKG